MRELTPEARRLVEDLQRRHGVSGDAVLTLLRALIAGGGAMAQFDHPELGGMGQWSRGGMVMVGDMFDHALKARVDALCSELAAHLHELAPPDLPVAGQSRAQSTPAARGPGPVVSAGDAPAGWWPAGLGRPASTGSQNDVHYAYFPETRRLAVRTGGRTTVYDTGEHRIGGFSQQQGGGAPFTFTGQHGPVRLADFPVVPSAAGGGTDKPGSSDASVGPAAAEDVVARIERLGELRDKGLLSEDEFTDAKAELLRRL